MNRKQKRAMIKYLRHASVVGTRRHYEKRYTQSFV